MGKPKTALHSLSAASTPKKAVFSAVKPDGIVFFFGDEYYRWLNVEIASRPRFARCTNYSCPLK